MVHNHGPEDGPGLACHETLVDGKLVGYCLWPKNNFNRFRAGEVILPGAFAATEGFKVPVKHDGMIVGRAEISRDGEIINAELTEGLLPRVLKYALLEGVADGISIRPNYVTAIPKNKEN